MSKTLLCVVLCLSTAFGQFVFPQQDYPRPRRIFQGFGDGAISFIPQSVSRGSSAFNNFGSRLRSTQTPSTTTTINPTPEVEKRINTWRTTTGERMCSIVQCFPILLIMAQRHQMCLDTHLIYKPPEPTKPPVSYDVALNTLLHALANRPHEGHDHHAPHGDHHHPQYGYPYEHDNPSYIYGTSHGHGYGVPYYGKDVKDVRTYVNSKDHGNTKVTMFTARGKGQSEYGHSYAPGVKVYAGSGSTTIPGVKVYATSGKDSGKEYTKVVPVNVNRYKVVIRNKRRKSAKLVSESEDSGDSCADESCINIRSCQPFLQILTNSKVNPGAVNALRRAHCGFEGNDPKVCCPTTQGFPTDPPPSLAPEPASPSPGDSQNTNVIMPDSKPNGGGSEPNESSGADSPYVDALPDPPECGFTNSTFGRVVNGIPAKLGDFPWMAVLGYHSRKNPGQPRWLCGGSLVTAKHVVSAAHCIHGRENDLYLARLGDLDLSSDDDGARPIDVPIRQKTTHEQYSAKSFTNDIGVLLLAYSVPFSFFIRPICLPRAAELRAQTFERFMPFIAGWGDTEFRGPSSPHLQMLQLPVVTNEFCANAYRAYKAQVIDQRVLCAGFEKGGRDACQGDSGGPLMQPIYNRITYKTYFYQTGVVSFGKKCAEPGFPGVYTRITHFMPWLQQQLTGHSDL